ncbi:MAG: hypothetical protein GX860_09990 [Alcaligenaceae bacterium]|nr:hypothetical protein [Alcaligenaceae bacterium]
MGKKLFILFLTLVVILSAFFYPVIATEDEENTEGTEGNGEEVVLGPGGLDFYSITIYYDIPTVVDYRYVSRSDSQKEDLVYYFNKGKKVYKDGFVFGEPQDKYVLRAGDTRDTGYTMYKERVTTATSNFVGLESPSYKNHALYSKFPYKYAYITHIQNDTTILTKRSIFFYGITRVSDDAGQINPNYIVRDDGYIATADGEYKIDINGYLLYEGDVWKDIDGNIIELFEYDEDYNLVLANRFDENGRIRFLRPGDQLFLYRVADLNGDGTYDESEILTDELGRKIQGEPVNGIPARKNKITKITIEIDALGTTLYEGNPEEDPQQQNEIILTIDGWYEQILADQHNAKKDKKGNILEPEKIKGQIVTTVKSVTTKTEANFTDKEKVTYKSIELDLTEEELNSLPPQAYVYLTFKINHHQPEEAYNEKQTEKLICIQVPDPVFEEQVKETDWLLIGAIGGGAFVVVVAEVIIIAAVATRKKKTAAANAPAEASTEQPKE